MDNMKGILKAAGKRLLIKVLFSTGGLLALLIIFIVVIIAAIIPGSGGSSIEGEGEDLSEEVLQFEDAIADEVEEQDLPDEATDVMLAILQQESGGNIKATNGDIFQSSESKCGTIGCIQDPNESIEQAVKYFKEMYDLADGNMKLAIQSYNFGGGFVDYAEETNDGEYSKETAIAFSQKKMDEVANPGNYTCIREEGKKHDACYGDILYVDAVMKYIGEPEDDEALDIGIGKGEFATPLESVTVTSEFGKRIDPITGAMSKHNGIDLACTAGMTKIFAAGDGEVIETDYSESLGNHVLIKHDDDTYTGYAHLSEKLAQGGEIKQGDAIGVCGQSGSATGGHLHFTVQDRPFTEPDREDFNPRDFLDLGEKAE